jgi:hypothetical protein
MVVLIQGETVEQQRRASRRDETDITDPNDGPARRILGAAQSIVSIVQTLATMATDKACARRSG